MHRPTSPQNDVQLRESDQFEGQTGSDWNKEHQTESRSSAADAGLDDTPWTEVEAGGDAEMEGDEDLPSTREISMSDLAAAQPVSRIQSPELSDLNAPGEVDIEDLDESDLDDTDLPLDARLDPLEP